MRACCANKNMSVHAYMAPQWRTQLALGSTLGYCVTHYILDMCAQPIFKGPT
jgi:hypothetical protein